MSWSFQLMFFWMRSGFPHRTHTRLSSAPDHSGSLALLLALSSRQMCHQDTSFKQSLPLQNLICFNLLKKTISINITAVLGAWNDSEQEWFIKWLRNPGDCGYPTVSEGGREWMNSSTPWPGFTPRAVSEVLSRSVALFEFWKWGVFLSTNKPTLQLLYIKFEFQQTLP